jgi:DNA-binding response OmpR family regulator
VAVSSTPSAATGVMDVGVDVGVDVADAVDAVETWLRESSRMRRVLVVEDDDQIAGLWNDILVGEGFEVDRMESALGLVAAVRRWLPDVVLLDLGLPFRSGAVALADLKADPETAAVPVVIVSAAPETLNAERRALATAVLTKPVGLRVLCATVRAAYSRPAPGTAGDTDGGADGRIGAVRPSEA